MANIFPFCFVPQEQEDQRLLPVEIKSRVSHNTIEEAQKCLESVVGISEYERGEKYMFSFRADDEKFHQLIESSLDPKRLSRELFQLLHHAYVFGSTQVLLIVGMGNQFQFAVRVDFPGLLFEAYGRLIGMCFDKWFCPFYKEDLEDFPMEKIEEALQIRNSKRKKKDAVDMHSFVTHLKLWRALNIHVTQGIQFPLPQMRMIIPFINAVWNSTKGPSDTMTKLLDSCEENLGIRTPQCVSVARLLGLLGIAFHRSSQTATSKDLSFYKTITAFRDAANERTTFQKSLATLVHLMKDELKELQAGPPLPIIPTTPPPTRTTRASRNVLPVTWHNWIVTGCTPKAGRPVMGNNRKQLTDEARAASCIGLVPILVEDERPNCRICGFQTHYICSGCKRPLCLTLGRKRDEKRNAYVKKFQLRESEKPPKYVSLVQFDLNSKSKKEVKGVNTCFHIAHAKQWDRFFSTNDNENDGQGFAERYFNFLHEFMDREKEN